MEHRLPTTPPNGQLQLGFISSISTILARLLENRSWKMDNRLFTESEMQSLRCLLGKPSHDGTYKDSAPDTMVFPWIVELEAATATNTGFGNVQNFANLGNYPINFPSATATHQEPVKKLRIFDGMCHQYKTVNGEIIKVFVCPICQKECSHQYTLNRHVSTHSAERQYCCYTCGKAFRQMSTLTQHKAIHSAERPHVCDICHKTFNRVSTLISHKKTHTGVKPHQCHLCPKAFHQKGNLRNHIFTHTRERPYKCDICNKGFNQKSNLTCHKSKAHQDQNHLLPQYNCEICDEAFAKRSEMRSHEQLHGAAERGDDFQNPNSAVRVDPIETDAMKTAIASGRTPFALLRPLSGVPVLVRVHPDGDKQMLLPATAEDLRKFGTISTRTKTHANADSQDPNAHKGSIVEIRLPVVATVIQTSRDDDAVLTVQSPGPAGDILGTRGGNMADSNVDSFIYISSLLDNIDGNLSKLNFDPAVFDNYDKDLLSMGNTNNAAEFDDATQASQPNTELTEDEMPDCVVVANDVDGDELNIAQFNCADFIDTRLLRGDDDYLVLPFE